MRATLLLLAVVLSGCPRPPDPDDGFRRELLGSLARNVALPHYRDFAAAAATLQTATAALETAVVAGGDAAAERAVAQQAWSDAMAVWQRAELHQLGRAPKWKDAFELDVGAAGRAHRDELYSWPFGVNSCTVDQRIVDQAYAEAGFFDTALVNAYGLDALEYLLFYTQPENTCPASLTINTSGAWDAIAADELARRRAAYAAAVAAKLSRNATALVAEWEDDGGAFARAMEQAGLEDAPAGVAQEALDQVYGAMLYLDIAVKDLKLAIPAGISANCADAPCPESVESRWANRSKEHLVANLHGFRAVFDGSRAGAPDATGFDDFLARRNASELVTSIRTATDEAIAAVEAIPGTLEDAVVSAPTEVAAAHTQIKDVTDLLKSQFATVLNLDPPGPGSDND